MILRFWALFLCLFFYVLTETTTQAQAQTKTPTKTPTKNRASSPLSSQPKAEKVFSTKGVIWSFDFLSEKELLVTLRKGQLLHVNLENKKTKQINTGLDIVSKGQGGLLDVHIKNYKGEKRVYLTYSTKEKGTLTTALAKATWRPKKPMLFKPIFIAKVKGESGRHFGSRLAFKDDHIYMSVGDRAERKLAQDLRFHNGKILRLTMDGKPALNNPFSKQTYALAEIWSYGHRNPQGIGFNQQDKKLYSAEFGPRGGDELNFIEAGKNYGWPFISDGYEYWGPKFNTHKKGMQRPVVFWTPSISPSGMVFYRGDKIPKWKNHLFLACLGGTHLRRLLIEKGKVIQQEKLFSDLGERIRHVRNGLKGYLYFSTDSGYIYKVTNIL